MAYLEIRGQRHPIGIGEMVIGCDAANEVAFGGDELREKIAILRGMPDGEVVVRRAGVDSEVLINGVRLGPQPTPLLHGDKIEVTGQELLFVDDRRSGSTEYIKAIDPSVLAGLSKSKPKGSATAGTGGRLISLTDGREYEIAGGSVLIGRDASCDIVISAKNVSRRHAEVVATPRGYVLIDNSTNGTLVNNERVNGQHVLARADVFRCGDHEFRFYADAAESEPEEASPPAASEAPVPQAPPQPAPAANDAAPSPTPPAPSPPPGQAAPPPPPPTPAKGAEQRLAHTMHGIPAMPRPGQAPKPPSPPPQQPQPAKGAEQRLAHTMHGIPAMPRPASSPPPVPPPGAQQRLQDTLHGVPTDAIVPPDRRSSGSTSLASFLVRSGSLKGQRLHVRVPIVNIGRAEYNDIVLPDDSVSTVHAKLQRREGIWVLVDLDSTNGTVVDGERVEGEAPLAPGAIVRFGTIQTIFEPTDDSVQAQLGGGTQVLQPVKTSPSGGSGRASSAGSSSAQEGDNRLRASMAGGSASRVGFCRPPEKSRSRTRRRAPVRHVLRSRRFGVADRRRKLLMLLLTSNGIR